jgi:hypothetical protein
MDSRLLIDLPIPSSSSDILPSRAKHVALAHTHHRALSRELTVPLDLQLVSDRLSAMTPEETLLVRTSFVDLVRSWRIELEEAEVSFQRTIPAHCRSVLRSVSSRGFSVLLFRRRPCHGPCGIHLYPRPLGVLVVQFSSTSCSGYWEAKLPRGV